MTNNSEKMLLKIIVFFSLIGLYITSNNRFNGEFNENIIISVLILLFTFGGLKQ